VRPGSVVFVVTNAGAVVSKRLRTLDEQTGRRPSMGASVAQGFGTIGRQVAERHEALASSRRGTTFQIFWWTKRTKRTKRWVKGGSDLDLSTLVHADAAVTPEPRPPSPGGTWRPLDLAGRRVYSRTAERYWILRCGDDELRFSHRSGAERWANKLAERGLSSELTWHDEKITSVPQDDRSVA
jgi:hypothetical protein